MNKPIKYFVRLEARDSLIFLSDQRIKNILFILIRYFRALTHQTHFIQMSMSYNVKLNIKQMPTDINIHQINQTSIYLYNR